jgi:large subunit ribosomal protein L13
MTEKRKFFLADAKGMVLGRFATKIAQILTGKHKPSYSPDTDVGDCVVVINAVDVRLTGKKAEQKFYFYHSGYPGGARHTTFQKMLKDHPEEIIKHAVKGMLPHNHLESKRIARLKIYPHAEHPHKAQALEPLV